MSRKKRMSGIILMTVVLAIIVYKWSVWSIQNDPKDVTVGSDLGTFVGVSLITPGGEDSRNSNKIDTDSRLYLKGDCAYFFLPAYADADKAVLSVGDSKNVFIDGKRVNEGDLLFSYIDDLNNDVSLRLKHFGACSGEYKLHVLKSENLPAVYIETNSKSMAFVDSNRDNRETGRMVGYDDEGNEVIYEAIRKISSRGNSTYTDTLKKSYSIEFEDEVDLFGMGKGKNWILLANSFDATKMRNALCYDLAKHMGISGTTKYQYIDLFLNGSYFGNYMVLKKIEVSPDMLNIGDESVFVEYISEDKRDVKYSDFSLGQDLIQVKYPLIAPLDVTTNVKSRMEKLYALNTYGKEQEEFSFEENKVDELSFSKLFIMDMVADEIDSNLYSTFYYIDSRDDTLYAGPVWDYDKAWGNYEPRAKYVNFNAYWDGIPEWLFENSLDFRENTRDYFNDNVSEYVNYLIDERVPELAKYLYGSVQMDIAVHGIAGSNADTVESRIIDNGDFEGSVDYLKDYIHGRHLLTYGVLNEPDEYLRIYFDSPKRTKEYIVKSGSSISSEEIEYIKKIFHCDAWELSDGGVLSDNYIFTENNHLSSKKAD